jgi:hypothetical protein
MRCCQNRVNRALQARQIARFAEITRCVNNDAFAGCSVPHADRQQQCREVGLHAGQPGHRRDVQYNTEEFESCRPFGMQNARVPAMPSDLVCKLERNSRLLDSSLQRR